MGTAGRKEGKGTSESGRSRANVGSQALRVESVLQAVAKALDPSARAYAPYTSLMVSSLPVNVAALLRYQGIESTRVERLEKAFRSLEGLAVGDAFGDRFFGPPEAVEQRLATRTPAAGPWLFTDDTAMAISVVDVLEEKGCIDRDLLAFLFGARYRFDPGRKYGGTAHGILTHIAEGLPWAEAAGQAWEGQGSMGNGGAMRAAPVGAFFFDDYELVAKNARYSAMVTHANPEGQAGAIAVAIAAAWVSRGGTEPGELFEVVRAHTPDSETRGGIGKASRLPLSYDIRTAVAALGNGSQVISQDTVPYCLWCVARHLGDYEEALWNTVSGLGDRDTTCAIVGGILALQAHSEIPAQWREATESRETMSRALLPVFPPRSS